MHESAIVGVQPSNMKSFKFEVTDFISKYQMKQLDVVVSPPAFLWDPYLTLTNVILDL